jgi:hypothetical protein
MTDIRALSADLGAGMTEAELHAKHWRPGPFSFGPDPADIDILMETVS